MSGWVKNAWVAMTGALIPSAVYLRATTVGQIGDHSVSVGSSFTDEYVLYDGRTWYGPVIRLRIAEADISELVGAGSEFTVDETTFIVNRIEPSDKGLDLLVLEPASPRARRRVVLPPVETKPYPDAAMPNLWVLRAESGFAEWFADLGPIARTDPDKLVDIIRTIVRAGDTHQVFNVNSLPLWDDYYVRVHGPLPAHLETRTEPSWFGDMSDSVVSSSLAVFDSTGRIGERNLQKLGAALADTEPVQDLTAKHQANTPALRITSNSAEDMVAFMADTNQPSPWIRITLSSDIWFPWIDGHFHPESDGARKFDNRFLAERHTPRLNAFLAEVAAAVRDAGGTWQLNNAQVDPSLSPWVSGTGIALDGVEPEGVMPPEAMNIEWINDEDLLWDEDLDMLFNSECTLCSGPAGWDGRTMIEDENMCVSQKCTQCGQTFWSSDGALREHFEKTPPTFTPGRKNEPRYAEGPTRQLTER